MLDTARRAGYNPIIMNPLGFGDHRGIVQLIVILLIAIVLVSYFGIDLQQAFTTPLLKKNLEFTWSLVVYAWNNYIYGPLSNLMNQNPGTITPTTGGNTNTSLSF